MRVRHYPTFSFDPLQVDRAFSQLANAFFETPSFGPAVRADWVDDQYVITVDLPGVPAEQVSVEVTGNTLKLAARSDDSEWSRTFRLGGSLDPEQVRARHLDGRLTVMIGKVAQPEARVVPIDTSRPEPEQLVEPAPAAIETASGAADTVGTAAAETPAD